ncbi:MoaC-domain-containing protein [Basidiobolus meristosporus CBS 931.73]|uniref:cyclic pyranopterin monophosphate synthase n=1 Tax=Basidiobolus meristosporus CBS 931.73 TaxID=1314790 RepID=A0A1Y1YHZ1_9FUNG|nr:MoaC-domain-containing protein [Basidiobolus meristosporus CBS 931.73]|eukprot:ORX97657.1 MoaC-domain-containing protein [Basidiobolus meristosporus CBS 931.73]
MSSLSTVIGFNRAFFSRVRRGFTTATGGGLQGESSNLTHIDPTTGKASMVSVTEKKPTHRTAIAGGRVFLGPKAFPLVAANSMKKGDVLTVSQIAGINGAKQTSNMIPLCHPLLLSHIDVQLVLNEKDLAVDITAKVECQGNTGVEMEALSAVSTAALTVFDMCKAVTKDMVLSDIKVLEKTGGKSGPYKHQSK